MTKLETLRRLNAERTSGRWRIEASGTGPNDTREILGPCGQDEIMVSSVHAWNEADAAFIAHLANSCTKLLDVIDAAQEFCDAYVLREDDSTCELLRALKALESKE